MMLKQVKWYVDISKWIPSHDEWLRLTASVGSEELDRINRYVFQEDIKSSLVGQALIRSFVSQATGRPSAELKIVRNLHGRPQICKHYKASLGISWPRLLDFNVSHSGNYCVLAGIVSNHEQAPEITVGVDVTKVVRKNSKQEFDRFLMLMSRREFLPLEWASVVQAKSDKEKSVNFTRLWCLKESFIKSIGLGLAYGLSRIQFLLRDSAVSNDKVINSTQVLVDSQLDQDWEFQETALDEDHLIAIGYNLKKSSAERILLDKSLFVEVKISQLLKYLTNMNDPEEADWISFSAKSVKLT